MSIVLRASKWAPEVTAFGFTSLNIKHHVSNVRTGKDTFELSFTDQQGQEYTIKLYSESPNTDIVVDDGTDERIVTYRSEVESETRDIHDAKTYRATRAAYAAKAAADEINERVVIDF